MSDSKIDPILLSLVYAAEKRDLSHSITLVIGGSLITGKITSSKSYHVSHSTLATLTDGDTELSTVITDKSLEFIHLCDAYFVIDQHNFIPHTAGTFFRAPLREVQGYTLGELVQTTKHLPPL